MKSAARIGAWTALVLALLVCGLGALLFAAPVQRALLRRALAADGATAVVLGNLHIQPSGLSADHVEMTRGGLRISSQAVVLRWHLAPFLSSRLLVVNELSGRDVEISQDQAAPPLLVSEKAAGARAAAAPAPSRPWSLTVEHLDLTGHFHLRRGAQVLQEADWQIRGGGIAPGATGEIAYTVAWRGPALSPAAVATTQGKIRLTEGAHGWDADSAATLAADFTLPELAQLRPETALLGKIQGHLEAAFHGQDGNWTAASARTTLFAADKASAVTLSLLTPLPLTPGSLPNGDLLAVSLSGMPLAWANPWLAAVKFTFTSGQVDGAARLAWREGAPVLTSLQLAASGAPGAPPTLTLGLSQPLVLSAAGIEAWRSNSAEGELAHFHCHDLPLAWVSRWLPPGHALAGQLAEGDSVLRSVKGQGLVLTTTQPWLLKDFRFLVGEEDLFHGDLRVSPQLRYSPEEAELKLTDFAGSDRDGNRLQGEVRLERRSRDGRLSAGTRLVLDLPALPHSRETFGPLQVTLAAAGRLHLDEQRGDLDNLALTVADHTGKSLLAISADKAVQVERTPQAEWLISSPDPLRFQTATLPVAWINPWLSDEHVILGGQLQATSMSLHLAERQLKIASAQPIAVTDFHFERGGETLLDQGLVHFEAGFDLNLTHRLLPKLSLTYSARLLLLQGLAAAGGADVARFSTRLWFEGTEKKSDLTGASGTLWADLGALGRLPLFQAARLPGRGELNLALSKVAQRADAIAVEAKVTGVQGRDGKAVPDLDISGRARVDPGTRVGALRIKAVLHSKPQLTDAAFVLKVDNQDLSVVDSTSALTSTAMDFDAIRGFAAAFAPDPKVIAARLARPTAVPGPKAAAANPAKTAPEPAWGNFRGTFTLDIKTLTFGGYTLDALSGQLALTNDTLSLSHLSGNVMGAHWNAALNAHFRAGDPKGEHRLDAQFSLHQLDAGKVLAQRFPKQAPQIDARLNLDLSVTSQATNLNDLFAHTSGKFALDASGGIIRLSLPGQDMRSTITLLGTVTFSPELRALSRLIGELSEMPLSRCEASGRLEEDGRLTLEQLHLEAPQLRIDLAGGIPDAKSSTLVTQPLAAHAFLAAHGDIAVILGGMKLLGPPGPDGFRPVIAPFGVTGTVGQPDLRQLYDLLAKAVSGSRGTWGLLMRKLQDKIKPPPRA